MPVSSALFAKLVHEAIQRIEPSYVRRIDGSKGGGTHSHVMQFATEVEVTSASVVWAVPDILYLAAGGDQGAFLINRAGLYAVSFAVARTVAGVQPVEIRVGTAVDNLDSDAKTRARQKNDASTVLGVTIAWTGFVSAAQHIWFVDQGTPGADDHETQVTIVRVG